jgi:hypothetical protein
VNWAQAASVAMDLLPRVAQKAGIVAEQIKATKAAMDSVGNSFGAGSGITTPDSNSVNQLINRQLGINN